MDTLFYTITDYQQVTSLARFWQVAKVKRKKNKIIKYEND